MCFSRYELKNMPQNCPFPSVVGEWDVRRKPEDQIKREDMKENEKQKRSNEPKKWLR
jgi:chromatin remodeling complex protein RSC6